MDFNENVTGYKATPHSYVLCFVRFKCFNAAVCNWIIKMQKQD